uniref:Kinesin-like protein n=1 Tax=Heterorhabditis bacteriophora TaxID=37862 RepID=A0A1I7XRB0_HETBA
MSSAAVRNKVFNVAIARLLAYNVRRGATPGRDRDREVSSRSKRVAEDKETVEVVCRLSPYTGPNPCLSLVDDSIVRCTPPPNVLKRDGTPYPEKNFEFSLVFDDNDRQHTVFERCAVDLVEHLITGRNGLLFTYGVEGYNDEYVCSVFVSYVEIYNNYCYDLLEEKSTLTKRDTRLDLNNMVFVEGATEVEVESSDEALEVFCRGEERRRTSDTLLNKESSRSHSVFSIRLVMAPFKEGSYSVYPDEDVSRIVVSQLCLVDLAGSERAKRTQNIGDRLAEAGNINKSLMVLRQCIDKLRLLELDPLLRSSLCVSDFSKIEIEDLRAQREKDAICIAEYSTEIKQLKIQDICEGVPSPSFAQIRSKFAEGHESLAATPSMKRKLMTTVSTQISTGSSTESRRHEREASQSRTPGGAGYYNPKFHRRLFPLLNVVETLFYFCLFRSKSAPRVLDHQPLHRVPTGGVLRAKLPPNAKQVTKPEVHHLQRSSDYMLTHQEVDQEGNISTSIVKDRSRALLSMHELGSDSQQSYGYFTDSKYGSNHLI